MTAPLQPTMTIDGVAATSAEKFSVINPANEELVAYVPDIGFDQLNRAIESSRSAFLNWRRTASSQRQALIRSFGERIAAHTARLAALLTTEQGKPLGDSQSEIGAASYWLIEMAKLQIPTDLICDTLERGIETRHVPIGVVAGIVPWSFPVGLAAEAVTQHAAHDARDRGAVERPVATGRVECDQWL
jgi:acyl-CoA reductase-like NAD-dependent aldehyde dehydrogenase